MVYNIHMKEETNTTEDLYWEHEQHQELIPDKCSECFKLDKELTEDKRREEAEQAERSELEETEEE